MHGAIGVQKLYRIVLLGATKAGKNSLANTIFGEELFKVDNTECQTESKSLHGRRITLVNTPDLHAPCGSEEKRKLEILKSVSECIPGPHAFLIVLNVEKSTEQQQAVIEKISQYFSEELFKYATVVFTQEDTLPEGMKTQKLMAQNKCLSDLVMKIKGRYHFIDNKYSKLGKSFRDQSQVEALLNTVDQIVKENKGKCYTSKMLPQENSCKKSSHSEEIDRPHSFFSG
ncbi:GTPase IMAP family member 4-like [Maylandia zebra]|uniref:GTPase IMAP family member 4-like n=1 Tax=Maylandia zebra TaxID=106582 RepID=UPI00403C4B6F